MKFEIHATTPKTILDKKQYWWRLVAGNGKTIADSGETYANKSHAIKMAQDMHQKLKDAKIYDYTGEK